jgi:hypothetical protein
MKHGDVEEAGAILMKRSFISFPNYYEVRCILMMNDKGIHFDCPQSSEIPSTTTSKFYKMCDSLYFTPYETMFVIYTAIKHNMSSTLNYT